MATLSGEEDCLSNCPAFSNMRPANEAMAEEDGEESALPPDSQDDSSPSESPIKRRPRTKAGSGLNPKKLRQSVGQASKQPLGSIPDQQGVSRDDSNARHGQHSVQSEGTQPRRLTTHTLHKSTNVMTD